MLIESLIRLGKPMLDVDTGLTAGQILRLVSNVADVTARGFLSHVFVVEIDKRDGSRTNIRALPRQEWGGYIIPDTGRKEVFKQDVDRAVGAPFVLPKGGNPLRPQGCYGVPVYPAYDRQLKAFVESAEEVETFLAGRVARTVGLELSEEEIAETALVLQRRVEKDLGGKDEKLLGLVVLAVTGDDGPYRVVDNIPVGSTNMAHIGPSLLEKGGQLAAHLDTIQALFWEAKLVEGAEMGHRVGEDAVCYFCGSEGGRVVSSYSKAWPWFTTTWNCPLPLSLKPADLVETIAVCPECYASLTMGANLFLKLARPLNNWLTKELFSPVSTAEGKDVARRGTPDAVYGCAYALPLLDHHFADPDIRAGYVDGIASLLFDTPRAGKADLHLQAVTGFEAMLPEEADTDDYRMTIIYYSGNVSRGDIHLRATIEDVLPSVARELVDAARTIGGYAVDVAQNLSDVSDQYRAFLNRRFSCLPFLLSTAYGAPYIWNTLSTVFHRGRISRARFVRNASIRMSEVAKKLPDGLHNLHGEVIFFLAFKQFLYLYHTGIAGNKGKGGYEAMMDWQELQARIKDRPVRELTLKDSEELGFAAGHLVRLFAAQYWHASGGKDFLKHRVMTFGSSLTPETIWKRALSRMDEYARRLDMKISDDLRQRFGLVLMEYSRLRDEIPRAKHEFMAAFWAGYALAKSPTESGNDNIENQ